MELRRAGDGEERAELAWSGGRQKCREELIEQGDVAAVGSSIRLTFGTEGGDP